MVVAKAGLALLCVCALGCGGAKNRGGPDAGGADGASDRADAETIADAAVDAKADASGDLARDALPGICVARKPKQALISDFSSGDNSAFGVAPGDEVVGQVSAAGNLQLAFDNAEWRTTGPFAYGGIAQLDVGWECQDIADLCPLDASDYGGIQFTIRSNAGPVDSADFFVSRNDDDIADESIYGCGTCVEPTDSGFRTGCLPPRATFAITRAPTVVTLRWSDFSGGLPHASADPSQIIAMYWFLHPAPPPDGGAGGTYEVDVTIDDIQFIPK